MKYIIWEKPVWWAPLHLFRDVVNLRIEQGLAPVGQKILDCGAGGVRPPLILFHEQGFEPYGIDISDQQLECARRFCQEHSMELNIQEGDMRAIPFADGFFSYVYEFHSMNHLSKTDIAIALQEMLRVLKPGGYLFVGFGSLDTWPATGQYLGNGMFSFGDEAEPGHGMHSAFTDNEPDAYFDGLEIVLKEKRVLWRGRQIADLSPDDWMNEWGEDALGR